MTEVQSTVEQFRAAAEAARAFSAALAEAGRATRISVAEYEASTGEDPGMQVIISNDKTGEQYEIDSADFRRGKHYQIAGDMISFEEAGFKIISLPNGEPYTGPLNDPPKAEKAD
jgi:hypothetical protein